MQFAHWSISFVFAEMGDRNTQWAWVCPKFHQGQNGCRLPAKIGRRSPHADQGFP
jgi:hypothetical protein